MDTQDQIWPRPSGIVHHATDDGTSRIYVRAQPERGITMIDHYYVGRSEYVELRLRELRAQALNDRLVREARGPRPLRRRLGRLLIAVGTALQGQPLEALVSESALMVSDDLCNRAPA